MNCILFEKVRNVLGKEKVRQVQGDQKCEKRSWRGQVVFTILKKVDRGDVTDRQYLSKQSEGRELAMRTRKIKIQLHLSLTFPLHLKPFKVFPQLLQEGLNPFTRKIMSSSLKTYLVFLFPQPLHYSSHTGWPSVPSGTHSLPPKSSLPEVHRGWLLGVLSPYRSQLKCCLFREAFLFSGSLKWPAPSDATISPYWSDHNLTSCFYIVSLC